MCALPKERTAGAACTAMPSVEGGKKALPYLLKDRQTRNAEHPARRRQPRFFGSCSGNGDTHYRRRGSTLRQVFEYLPQSNASSSAQRSVPSGANSRRMHPCRTRQKRRNCPPRPKPPNAAGTSPCGRRPSPSHTSRGGAALPQGCRPDGNNGRGLPAPPRPDGARPSTHSPRSRR